MSAKLIVDKEEGLKELREKGLVQQPAPVQFTATALSYLFHPVFVPVWLVLFLLYIHPYVFAGFSQEDKIRVLIQSVVMFAFFPVITVLLLKALKFVDSLQLATQKDRIIPLVACGVWYFWIWYVWRNLPDYPHTAVQLALAIWIAVSLALLANIIMKVSLHAISVGVMITFMILLAFSGDLNFGIYLSVAVLIAGLVCTARFIVSDHHSTEIYGGLALGAASMLIADLLG